MYNYVTWDSDARLRIQSLLPSHREAEHWIPGLNVSFRVLQQLFKEKHNFYGWGRSSQNHSLHETLWFLSMLKWVILPGQLLLVFGFLWHAHGLLLGCHLLSLSHLHPGPVHVMSMLYHELHCQLSPQLPFWVCGVPIQPISPLQVRRNRTVTYSQVSSVFCLLDEMIPWLKTSNTFGKSDTAGKMSPACRRLR